MNSSERRLDIAFSIVIGIICILCIIPFIMLISISFSNEKDIMLNGYKLIPQHLSLEAYKYVFKNPNQIVNAYKITIVFSIVTVAFSVLLQSLLAYPLSRKKLRGRQVLSFGLYFTMLFNGGLVANYIWITKYLHLTDSIWVYILPALINPWYVFMIRTFFSGVPEEMIESAKIDGESEFGILFRFVMPLSKPVLATVALFVFLEKWNDWNTSLLYIRDYNKVSLQYFLQRIMENITALEQSQGQLSNLYNAEDIPSETVRMALAIIAAGPALFVLPFAQKYFVRGLTIGAVKG